MRYSLVQSLLCFGLYFSAALSFSVTVGSSPTQCDPLNVTWIGGQAPFEILLTPVFDIPRNISVPAAAFDNNQGSYQISHLPFPNGTTFLLTMSDATGFGTGGTSDLLTVGMPVGGASCNTTNPSLPFSFSLPSSLQQCNPYVFDGFDGATLPITITGLIPGGDSFLLYTPSTGTSFTWVTDVAAGTTIIFSMTDAQGRSGGSSDTEMVALSNDASCLNASSPSSTMSAGPSSTSATSSSTSSPTRSSSDISTGTIIGTAFGVVLAVTAIVTLAIFYLKRQRYRRSPYAVAPTRNPRRPNSVELDPDNFEHSQIYPFPYQTDSVSRLPAPAIPSSSAIPVSHQGTSLMGPSDHASEIPYTEQRSRAASNTDSFAAYGDIASSSMSSSGRRKAAMAGVTNYQPVTRFIVHTDVEDYVPEGEAEVVELPPQYSERRSAAAHTQERPISGMTGLSSTNLTYPSGQGVDVLPQPSSHLSPQ